MAEKDSKAGQAPTTTTTTAKEEQQQQQQTPPVAPVAHRRKRPSYAYEHFRPRRQLGKILFWSLCRWLLTAALVASIYIVLWHYSDKDVLSLRTKREFNALVVGLSICLGLNIASSLKAMAGEIRWWILSLRDWPIREADLIMQADKLTHVMHLGWVSTCIWMKVAVLAWIVINVASQVALATLGLTYSTNPSKWASITRLGNVTIPDMSNLETGRIVSSKSQAVGALRYTANSYGTIALGWIWATLDDVPKAGTLWDNDDPLVYCGTSVCQYVFQESAPEAKNYELTVSTNRSVEVSGNCTSWRVLRGGDGTFLNITIENDAETEIELPVVNGEDQTTFMVDVSTDQGPTWSIISAFEASTTKPWYYVCNVSVGPVINSQKSEHNLGVNITSLASSAIALQGYGASSLQSANNSYQYQSYPAESAYGSPQNGSVGDMETLVAAFATGVIAVTAQANTDITVEGMQPQKSVVLDIPKWAYVHIILCLTLGLQLLLALVVGFLSNKVLMRDDSHLSTAAVLMPTVHKVGEVGIVANGKEIASMFRPGTTMTYMRARGGFYQIKTSP